MHNPFLSGLSAHFTGGQIRRLGSTCVGIAGAGGLGSNCAVHLVRSGIRRLVIVDFDVVNPSNLNRQFYFMDQVGKKKVIALEKNLKRINSDLAVSSRDIRLDVHNVHKVFETCHVIVEALDDAREKKMMAEAFMSDSRILVCASGIAGWGKSDRIRTRRVHDSFFLVGDGVSEVGEKMPPTSAVVSLAAAKQADVVIEAILDNRNQRSKGRLSALDLSDP